MKRAVLIVCVASSIWLAIDGFQEPERFLRSYLMAYLYWLALSLGALPLLMTHHLTSSHWGQWMRGILEASIRCLPVMAILILPIVAEVHVLYPWAHGFPGASASHKALYFNPTFFRVRALAYFACWGLLGWALLAQERSVKGLGAVSAGGLVPLGFTLTFASIDWQMSVDPLWYSTIYGMVFAVGQALEAWAFAIIVLTFLLPKNPSHRILRDLGNLLLMLVILWTYLSFMQYLVVWSGNLPDEVTWYLERTRGGWEALAIALCVCQFALPFAALLFRETKHRPRVLRAVATWVLLARAIEQHWLVAPGFYPAHFHLGLSDLAAWLSIGGIWLGLFLRNLRSAEITRSIAVWTEIKGVAGA